MPSIPEDRSGTSSVAERLIASLEAEAEMVDHGAFTLDHAKAREKLREYQLVAPDFWVLLVVELAALLGAKAVYFDYTEPALTQVRFRCRGFGPAELGDPMSGVFVSTEGVGSIERSRRRAWQKLAIAYNALLGLGPRRVELACLDEQGKGLRMRWTGDSTGAVEVDKLERSPDEGGNTLIVEFGERGSSERIERERKWLREHCRHSPLLVMAGSDRLSFGCKALFESKEGEPELETFAIRDEDLRSIGIGSHTGSGRRPTLRLQTNGVFAEEMVLPDGFRNGFLAIVDLDLARDLSQSQVLRDAQLTRTLEWVRAAHDEMVEKIEERERAAAEPAKAHKRKR